MKNTPLYIQSLSPKHSFPVPFDYLLLALIRRFYFLFLFLSTILVPIYYRNHAFYPISVSRRKNRRFWGFLRSLEYFALY